MLSVGEKLSKLQSLIETGDIQQFDQLIGSEKFIAGLPKRHPELLFLMYQGASNPLSAKHSLDKAEKLLDVSVNLKHPPAIAEKGRLKFESAKTAEDYMDAEDLFRASIEECSMSRYYIARIYHEGLIKRGDVAKFDHKEAKLQLAQLVSDKGDYYVESVILMAEVILHINDISERDEIFFSAHVSPLAKVGDESALRLLCLFNIIRLKSSVALLNSHNESKLSVDYFDVKFAINRASSHLQEVSKLIGSN